MELVQMCENCKFWEKERCRRNPPIFVDEEFNGKWPKTSSADFCGEFKEKPAEDSDLVDLTAEVV